MILLKGSWNGSSVLLGASRRPIGGWIGALVSVPAAEIKATAIRGALTGVEPAILDAAILGLVPPAGAGHRRGQGLRAVLDRVSRLRKGEAEMLVAGRMESMSQAPHLVTALNALKARDLNRW